MSKERPTGLGTALLEQKRIDAEAALEAERIRGRNADKERDDKNDALKTVLRYGIPGAIALVLALAFLLMVALDRTGTVNVFGSTAQVGAPVAPTTTADPP